MKPSLHVPSVAITIFSAASLLFAQTTLEDTSYLNQASKFAATSEVEQDEVIRFEADVTGDGSAEVFYTKASLRDGKQGYIWSVFANGTGGTLRPIGDVTFSVEVFTPSAWKGDDKSKGFYTYFPSGGSRGSLAFFEVTASGITRRESRKIEPNGADKAEFDGLFAARLTCESPKIDLKRTALPMPQNTTAPSRAVNVPPESRAITPAAKNAPEATTPPTLTPSEEPTSPTPWSIIVVLIVIAIALLWLSFKARR